MKLFKFYIAIIIVIILTSCGTIRDGFSNQKKNNSDEFLVEKKSPLVMPPDYNELPIPNREKIEKKTKDIESLILKSKQEEINEDINKKNSSFEDLILKKIKKN
jgi:hypothetical protein